MSETEYKTAIKRLEDIPEQFLTNAEKEFLRADRLRHEYAKHAMQAILSNPDAMQGMMIVSQRDGKPIQDVIAVSIFRYADAALKASASPAEDA